MSKSLQHIDRSVIFREVFNSLPDINRNKGISTNVMLSNGVGYFNGVTSKIEYKPVKFGLHSIRVKIKGAIGGNIIAGDKANYYWFYTLPDRLRFYTRGNSIFDYMITDKSPLANSEMVYTESASFCYLYVNGLLVASKSISSNTSARNLLYTIGTLTSQYWNGSLELFEIYNRVLNATEVKLLYQQRMYTQPKELPLLLDFDSTSGVLQDRTGRNIIPNNIVIRQFGRIKSAYFNRTGQVNCGSNFIPDKVTISIWVNPHFQLSDYGLLFRNTSTNSTSGIRIGCQPDSTLFYIDGGGNILNNISGKKFGKFQHLLFYIDKTLGNIKAYYNGVSVLNANRTIVTGTANVFIGDQTSSLAPFKGYISKVQVFDGIPSDISSFASQLYNSQKIMLGL